LDKTRIEDLTEVFKSHWAVRSDIYKGMAITRIVFRFRFLESNIAPAKSILKFPSEFEEKGELLPQSYTNLPSNRLFEN